MVFTKMYRGATAPRRAGERGWSNEPIVLGNRSLASLRDADNPLPRPTNLGPQMAIGPSAMSAGSTQARDR